MSAWSHLLDLCVLCHLELARIPPLVSLAPLVPSPWQSGLPAFLRTGEEASPGPADAMLCTPDLLSTQPWQPARPFPCGPQAPAMWVLNLSWAHPCRGDTQGFCNTSSRAGLPPRDLFGVWCHGPGTVRGSVSTKAPDCCETHTKASDQNRPTVPVLTAGPYAAGHLNLWAEV